MSIPVPAGGENMAGGGGNSNGRSRKAVLKMLGALYSSNWMVAGFSISPPNLNNEHDLALSPCKIFSP